VLDAGDTKGPPTEAFSKAAHTRREFGFCNHYFSKLRTRAGNYNPTFVGKTAHTRRELQQLLYNLLVNCSYKIIFLQLLFSVKFLRTIDS